MTLERKIDALTGLNVFLNPENEEVKAIAEQAYQHNRWFTPENIFLAMKNISGQFLQKEKIEAWLSNYSFPKESHPKTVGIIMAGNIPLVGFHDFLCVLLSGHRALVKLSSKDDILFPFLLKKLFESDKELTDWVSISEMLKGLEGVIATGSNNSSRYFEYYFGKYPHIIRKNRSSVAVLTGDESKDDLEKSGVDIFSYFGLGCRNVSKLMVPSGYKFDFFFESIESFRYVMNHNKYKNNYDYNRTLLLMNKTPYLSNDFLMVHEDTRIVSPVAMLNYEFYPDKNELQHKLFEQEENIQCIVGENFIPFGQSQAPELWDYADKVDTMRFLSSL